MGKMKLDSWNVHDANQDPDLRRVTSRNATDNPDVRAADLNSEGWRNIDGKEFTGDSLVETFKSGQGRNIFVPEKNDVMIARKLRGPENDWIERQPDYIAWQEATEGIDPGAIGKSNQSLSAGVLEEVRAQGLDLPEEIIAAELEDYFASLAPPSSIKGEFKSGELPGISAAETFDLANPETEIGREVLSNKDMTPTTGMFEAKPEAKAEPPATKATFAEMVDDARRWKGAAIKADQALGDDKKARLAHSQMTTKGDLDAYLMKKYGLDSSLARDVSNELTRYDLKPDETAEIADFAGEPWADKALTKAEKETPAPGTETIPPDEKIEDFGEKIGGARKDIAERDYTMTKAAKPEDKAPAWKKRFKALEKVDGSGQWAIADTKADAFSRTGQTFPSQEAAEAAIPLYAVARQHTTYQNSDGTHSIYKKVSDRKRLKVVNQDFPSREEAMKYMAEHAEDILNIKTLFGEEILPVPDTVQRKGVERRTEDATPEMFVETFAPRGIEFGNWNNQEERQQVMNHAYDGLLDLADVLGLPPKALMLNGDLAIAFGARGQGLTGAKAHYEHDYGIINLTKMKGAGSLGHEWLHALDHYLGRLDTKAKSEKTANARGDMVYPAGTSRDDMLSHGASYKSQLRPEIKEAYKTLVESMYKKAEQYVEDTKQADRFVGTARENLKSSLNEVRISLAADHRQYIKTKFGNPASAEQLAEFDRLANILAEGGDLETTFRYNQGERPEAGAKPKGISRSQYGRLMAGRHTNDTLESLNAILKAVRNRQVFSKEGGGPLDRVRAAMGLYSARIKMFEDAQAGTEKTKKVPTSFAIEAKKMDQARSGDYWSEPHEMAARAFASYVEDKVEEKGGQSDFLVYHAHGGILLPMIDGFVARPYPEGSERAAINAAFDSFVKEIKTRETGKGVEWW